MLFYRNDELLIRCVTKGQKMASNLHKICINLHKNGVIIRSDSTRVVSHKSKGFSCCYCHFFKMAPEIEEKQLRSAERAKQMKRETGSGQIAGRLSKWANFFSYCEFYS